MDVTCNRCGTIYEFEEGLISATGTTVKCTQCGHLFKVHRTAAPPTPKPVAPEAEEALKWRVRRVDGSTHSLESLAELTPLISAGQFHRDDEISRTGQIWRKLGDIAELASLFEGLPPRARRLSQPPPPPLLSGEPAEPRLGPDADDARSTEPRPRRRSQADQRFQVMGAEVDLSARTQPMQPIDAATAETIASPPAPPARPREPAEREAEPSMPMAVAVASSRPPAPTLDSEPSDDAGRSPWLLRGFAIGIPLLIAAAVAGALFVRARQSTATAPAQPARDLLSRGDQALASHRAERFDEAIAEYGKALAFAKDDPHILSSISRVYAVWSQSLRFSAALATRTGSASTAELASLQGEARRLAEQAKLYGERAAQRNPGNEEASVALSDALRLSGNLVSARAELDRARATQGMASAETLRVAALLAMDEANGDLAAARPLAERAVAQDPSMIRARLLLLRCLIATGELDAARAQLESVRKLDVAPPLLAEIAAELALAAKRVQAHKPSSAPSPEARGSAAPKGPASANTPQAAETERPSQDPMELVRRGEAALERGAVQSAEHAFEQALALSPHLARAETGLGYVALERSQPNLAVTHFRPAAKSGHAEAFIGLGDAYRRLGRSRDALDAYKTYLQRYPTGARSSIAQRQSELLTEQLGSGAR
jgi:predicted Zn finger-like uncharacterized protein